MKFKNKVVLVTGGATGIGRVMCLQFARHGAAVIVNYSKSTERAKEVVDLIEAMGSSIIYCAAKAALASITKSLARTLAPEIRVNAIAPGFVDTGFVNWTPEVLEQLQRKTRLGRSIVAEDIADAAVFLAADANASTGQTILVDGGVVALGPNA
jgi:3-oxoacyl-[acyl-carrier protein] reductase